VFFGPWLVGLRVVLLGLSYGRWMCPFFLRCSCVVRALAWGLALSWEVERLVVWGRELGTDVLGGGLVVGEFVLWEWVLGRGGGILFLGSLLCGLFFCSCFFVVFCLVVSPFVSWIFFLSLVFLFVSFWIFLDWFWSLSLVGWAFFGFLCLFVLVVLGVGGVGVGPWRSWVGFLGAFVLCGGVPFGFCFFVSCFFLGLGLPFWVGCFCFWFLFFGIPLR